MQNTRVLSSGHKHRLVRGHTVAAEAPAAVDEAPFDAQTESESTSAAPLAPNAMRRSVSLGNKPRPPALDLTCIPDLMPDVADLAAPPADVDKERAPAAAPEAAGGTDTGVGDAAAPPAAQQGTAKPGQAVVRTPVAQRVLRMNKLSKGQDVERVHT